MDDYVIQYGDTLKTIAAKKLGDENRWYEIALLNNIAAPYEVYIGETIKLPNRISMLKLQPPALTSELPAAVAAYARGFLFVVFEQLPTIGADKVIRKIAVIPNNFSNHPNLSPKNPFSVATEADHALGNNSSRFLSASNRPIGSPTNVNEGVFDAYGGKSAPNANPRDFVGKSRPVIIDINKLPPGTRVVTETELLTLLEQEVKLKPNLKNRIATLMERIKNVEGEVLIEGSAPKTAVSKVNNVHSAYILTAEELTAKRALKQITEAEYQRELKLLTKSYDRLKIVGKAGRVITVVGAVFTAVELTQAAQKSYEQNSFKPITAESIRQVGGWGGGIAGAKLGFLVGAALGVETGPGLFITGAIGAIIVGAAGYYGADWVADWIDDNSVQELRKDVNRVESIKDRTVTLTVGTTENQYEFRRRALVAAALEAQRESLRMFDNGLPLRFAEKFAPLRSSTITNDYQLSWIKGSDGKNPKSDKNTDGIINQNEWKTEQGTTFTYKLNENEVDELIKMLFGLSR